MTHSTCIRHPEKTRYIQVYEWQIKFCQGNHCAALLLSFFINWHDWKLRNDQYYKRANDIAEMHGDGRPHGENAYLFFTTEELITGCMEFYGKKAINAALELLTSLRVITTHQNPNPRYHFDKTKYFRLYPTVCNRWIADAYPLDDEEESNCTQPIDSSDRAKVADRLGKNALPTGEKSQPSGESCQAITNTTNNTTNKIQSINAREDFIEDVDCSTEKIATRSSTQHIVTALTEKGMPAKRFYHPDVIDEIHRLQQAGATLDVFMRAYDMAKSATQTQGFGVSYLVKVVHALLTKDKKKAFHSEKAPPTFQKDRFSNTVYEEDMTNARQWMKEGESDAS